jgi:hypothetical protein
VPRPSKKQVDCQREWEDKILRAKKVRKDWKGLFMVDKAREYLDGKQRPTNANKEEWVTVNKIYSHLKAQLPALYSADPYFYVKLRKSYSANPMDIALWEQRGKIRQAMLNYLKEELQLKIKARLAIQDAHTAYGVIKTRYHADDVENPDYGSPILSDDGETPLYSDTGDALVEPEFIPINERYKLDRIHPDDFLWDEDAGPLEDEWSWVAQRIREPWAKALKNPRYNKTALRKLKSQDDEKDEDDKAREVRKKGNDVKGRSERRREKRKETKEPRILVAWEIYNIEDKKWLIIAENGEIPLMDEQDLPPGVETHPFSILRFTLRDDSPYQIPPLSQMIPLQEEYNKARSDIQKHRKRFNRKYEVLEQALSDDSEISKLESGDDGTMIMVQATGAVKAIQDAPLDQMRYQELGFLNGEMIEVGGGASDEARGIAGADSATQAGILDKRLEMKEGDAMGMVTDFAKDIARKLDMLVQAHITQDEAVRITGPQGEFWELVRVRDYQEIDGEYEYSVNVGSTVPRMPQMERASWTAFLTLLSQFPHLLTQKHLLKRMAEMHHIEDEAMLEDLFKLGQQIMGGQAPMPGNTGSQPGVGEDRPVSAIGGQAGGVQSLNLPMAGNG